MGRIYFKATINNVFIYVETTEDLVNKLFDHFMDGGYTITKLEEDVCDEAVKNGEVVYYATTPEIVDEFIENSNKITQIRNNG